VTARLYMLPLIVAVVALGYFFSTSSTELAPEQAAQMAVLEIIERIEAHDLDGVLAFLSPDLEGGAPSRSRVSSALLAMFAVPGWRHVALVVEDYRTDGDHVTAILDAALVSEPAALDEETASLLRRATRVARLRALLVPEGQSYRVRELTFKRLERR
jgi:hypothetical protein